MSIDLSSELIRENIEKYKLQPIAKMLLFDPEHYNMTKRSENEMIFYSLRSLQVFTAIIVLIILIVILWIPIMFWLPLSIIAMIIEYFIEKRHNEQSFNTVTGYGFLGPLYPGFLLFRKVFWRYY